MGGAVILAARQVRAPFVARLRLVHLDHVALCMADDTDTGQHDKLVRALAQLDIAHSLAVLVRIDGVIAVTGGEVPAVEDDVREIEAIVGVRVEAEPARGDHHMGVRAEQVVRSVIAVVAVVGEHDVVLAPRRAGGTAQGDFERGVVADDELVGGILYVRVVQQDIGCGFCGV
ncbi:hypothetical protein D3C87_1162950 [compost metagenome]